jgi:hypothetical protein
MATRNPFKPTAGATPPLLVGREAVLGEFEDSVADGPGAPLRLSLFTGARGVGKTVMLTEVSEVVAARGWVAIADTASPGLVARLASAATAVMEGRSNSRRGRRRLQGVTFPQVMGIGGGGFSLSAGGTGAGEAQGAALRRALGALLDDLEQTDIGLLITVDEVHARGRKELRDLAPAYQHLVREKRNVALAMAGLPSAVSDLLNDDVLTFLRRATPIHLPGVDLEDARLALRGAIEAAGRGIRDDALELAATATGGYPYLIQLVGYHTWRASEESVLDVAAVERALPVAHERLGSTVLATALADLSPRDREYLATMARDDGASETAVVARRMGLTSANAGAYRRRVIAAGLARPTRRGSVDFALPYLREYLRSGDGG